MGQLDEYNEEIYICLVLAICYVGFYLSSHCLCFIIVLNRHLIVYRAYLLTSKRSSWEPNN